MSRRRRGAHQHLRRPEPTGRGFMGSNVARAGAPLGYLPLKKFRPVERETATPRPVTGESGPEDGNGDE